MRVSWVRKLNYITNIFKFRAWRSSIIWRSERGFSVLSNSGLECIKKETYRTFAWNSAFKKRCRGYHVTMECWKQKTTARNGLNEPVLNPFWDRSAWFHDALLSPSLVVFKFTRTCNVPNLSICHYIWNVFTSRLSTCALYRELVDLAWVWISYLKVVATGSSMSRWLQTRHGIWEIFQLDILYGCSRSI